MICSSLEVHFKGESRNAKVLLYGNFFMGLGPTNFGKTSNQKKATTNSFKNIIVMNQLGPCHRRSLFSENYIPGVLKKHTCLKNRQNLAINPFLIFSF